LAGLEKIMANQRGGEIRDANNIIQNAKEEPRFPKPSSIHKPTGIIKVLKSRRLLKGRFNYGG